MAVYTSTFTIGSAGNKSVSGIPFLPTELEFYISQKFNTPEDDVAHLSIGYADGTTQHAHSILADSTGNHTRVSKTKCLTHYIRVAGALTKTLEASFVSFDDNGGGDYGFTVNATAGATNSNYQIHFKARG